MPIRTSLVTRKKSESSDFFRFTIQKGELIFDGAPKYPGRGGYVEKSEKALSKLPFLKKKIMHFLKVSDFEIPDQAISEQIKLLQTSGF